MSNSTSALRRSTISMLAFLGAAALWAVVLPGIASAVTFTVNRNDDIAPRGTGSTCITAASTDCTLREAVIKLNATAAYHPGRGLHHQLRPHHQRYAHPPHHHEREQRGRRVHRRPRHQRQRRDPGERAHEHRH